MTFLCFGLIHFFLHFSLIILVLFHFGVIPSRSQSILVSFFLVVSILVTFCFSLIPFGIWDSTLVLSNCIFIFISIYFYSALVKGPHFLCEIVGVVSRNMWLISCWEENKLLLKSDKMTNIFPQNDNFDQFEWNICNFVHLLSL